MVDTSVPLVPRNSVGLPRRSQLHLCSNPSSNINRKLASPSMLATLPTVRRPTSSSSSKSAACITSCRQVDPCKVSPPTATPTLLLVPTRKNMRRPLRIRPLLSRIRRCNCRLPSHSMAKSATMMGFQWCKLLTSTTTRLLYRRIARAADQLVLAMAESPVKWQFSSSKTSVSRSSTRTRLSSKPQARCWRKMRHRSKQEKRQMSWTYAKTSSTSRCSPRGHWCRAQEELATVVGPTKHLLVRTCQGPIELLQRSSAAHRAAPRKEPCCQTNLVATFSTRPRLTSNCRGSTQRRTR